MGRFVLQFFFGILLIFLTISCEKEQEVYEDFTNLKVIEDSFVPLGVDDIMVTSWITDDLYIFPVFRDSVLLLRAYDINTSEKYWELESKFAMFDLYKCQMVDDRYLTLYAGTRLRVFDVYTQVWLPTLNEEEILPNFESKGNGFKYIDGKYYGSIFRRSDSSLAIYSFDVSSLEIEIVFEYHSNLASQITSIALETNASNEVEMYAVLNERGTIEQDGFVDKWKLLHLADGKVIDEFFIRRDTTDIPFVRNRIHQYDDLLVINNYQSVYIIDKNDGSVVTHQNYNSFFGQVQTKLVDNVLFIIGGIRIESFDLATRGWGINWSPRPSNVNDIEINGELVTYGNTQYTLSYNPIRYSTLRARNKLNNQGGEVEVKLDDVFSSPKYFPAIDKYLYHTPARLIWFDLKSE
jgi:hypothetical protein